MSHNITIGAQIKALRKEKKYTLKQLSEESGLSIGFLSQLERGLTTIAIDSLEKVAAVLEVPLVDFFASAPSPHTDPVVRSYSQIFSQFSPEHIQFTLSHSAEEFQMFPRLFVLLPSSKETSDVALYQHEGEEFIYVLEGVLSMDIGNRHYTLYPGDSVQVHSNMQHNWKNKTNNIVKILSVNTPNPFHKTAE